MRLQIKFQLLLSAALTLCFIASDVRCQESRSAYKPTGPPLNMLILGDSIMWGEGLTPENKFSYQIKIWLTQTTGRQVTERTEAHAGAVIETVNVDGTRPANDGEVNVAVPTLNQQLDVAVRHYANGPQVDLVLTQAWESWVKSYRR